MRYSEIPEHLRPYVVVENAREFNRLSDRLKEKLVRDAERDYNLDHEEDEEVEQEDFPFNLFKRRIIVHKETRQRSKWVIKYAVYTSRYPIVLTPNTLSSFADGLERRKIKNLRGGYDARKYIIRLDNMFINTQPNTPALMASIEFHLDEYDGDIFVDQFTIHLTKNYSTRNFRGSTRAGNGEGVPRYLSEGFWMLDLFYTKTKCIRNSAILWDMYRSGKVDGVINGDTDDYYGLVDEANRKLKGTNPLTFDHINLMYDKISYDVMYGSSGLSEIQPYDTNKTCWFVYDNGHVGLLVHEKYLESRSITKLESLQYTAVVHKIQNKKKKPEKIEIITADIECNRAPCVDGSNLHEPLLIGQYSKKDKYIYFRGEEALDEYFAYLVSEDRNWMIWFHNGGRYDTHFLLEYAEKYCDVTIEHPIKYKDLNGKFIEMTVCLSNEKTITFRDSCALIPGSLKQLSKDLGNTEKMVGINIKDASRKDILECPRILKYNEIDCKATYDILKNYQSLSIKKFGTNPLQQVTASSFAKRIFYTKYYDINKYPLYVLSKHVHDFINEGYAGGRNEVFKRGVFTGVAIFPYDFTAHYPGVGRMLIPYGVPIRMKDLYKIKKKDMKNFLEINPGFYKVTIISAPKDKIPLHGVFHNHRLVFPYFDESDEYVFFSKELELGIKIGYKYRLLHGYTQKLGPVCKEFFEDMIKIKTKAKAKGQTAMEYVGKITANAGYGYFGFNKYNRNVMNVYGKDAEDHLISLDNQAQLCYRKQGNIFLSYEKTNVMLPDTNIGVAAAITSYARMKMWELLQDIVDYGGVNYYCDTDSVYSSIDIIKHPILGPKWCGPGGGKNLGELKPELREGEIIKEATFVGCKTYGYYTNMSKYHTKSKGTKSPFVVKPPGTGADDKEYEEYIESVKEQDEMYTKIRKLIKKPQDFMVNNISVSRTRKIKEDMKIYDKNTIKTITGVYNKGIVMNNGDVIPHTLSKRVL